MLQAFKIRLEISLVVGNQVAALPGLGILQREHEAIQGTQLLIDLDDAGFGRLVGPGVLVGIPAQRPEYRRDQQEYGDEFKFEPAILEFPSAQHDWSRFGTSAFGL